MAYVLDALVILLVVVMIAVGKHRGFAKSLVRLVGGLAAVVVAAVISQPVAEGVFDRFLATSAQETIREAVVKALPVLDDNGTATPTEAAGALDTAMEKLPDVVQRLLRSRDTFTGEQVTADWEDSERLSAEALAGKVVQTAVRPAAVALLRLACFLVLWLILLIVVLVLASVIGKVFRLPVLRQIDGTLGAIIGAVEGVVLAFALTAGLLLAGTFAGNDSSPWLAKETWEQTRIVRWMMDVNPVLDLFE